jgi:nucleoside-diphosphate-sugar epimerase
MNIFLAGASGAVGRPLLRLLQGAGHHVTGATRSESGAAALAALGATAALVDVFDAAALERAVLVARPEVVIHQLTALNGPPPPTPDRLAANARIRREGTPNLVRAARAAGARRLVAQSIAWVYAPKALPYREDDPLNTASGNVSIVQGVVPLEQAVLNAPGLEGIVLRYGQFYGPGTWSEKPAGASPVHVEAAAYAAFLAIDHGRPGIYNIAEPGSEACSDKAVAELGWRADFRL